jgi:hypothetical protein
MNKLYLIRYYIGDEVIPENEIVKKYNYYVNTGDIFLAGDKAGEIAGKIINVNYTTFMQDTLSGNSKWGYWVKIIYYDKYKQGKGDAINLDTEDWWERY